MASTEYRDTLAVEPAKLVSVITRYEDYPEFVEGCTSVEVQERTQEKTRVEYRVNVMSQDVVYTLDHFEDPVTGKIEWNLVDSNFFKKNSGSWEIKANGKGKSEVLYSLDVEFKIPVPGFILNRLVKGSLPGMVKSFEKQAKKS